MACACSEGLFNSGRLNNKSQNQPSSLIMVHLKDSSGALNTIPASQLTGGNSVDATYVEGKIEDSDPKARWYPIGEFKDQTSTRDEPITQDFNDGTSEFVRENPRQFTGMLTSTLPLFLPRLNYWKCQDFGIFEVDDCGNINGQIDAATGDLHPVAINSGSWHASFEPKNNESVSMVRLTFQTSKTFRDADYRTLENGVEVTTDLTDIAGLLDLQATETSAPTTTSFAIAVTKAWGREWNKIKAIGLEDANWTLRNTTTGSTVAVTVAEAPDGTYTFTYTAQTSADVLTIEYIGAGVVLEPFTLTAVA